MNRTRLYLGAMLALAVPALAKAERARLGGSPASMEKQHEMAVAEDYTFLRTPAQVREYVDAGRLERVASGADYALSNVSFPFARPEVRVLIERLGAQYREAHGERLVVTSLTRPTALQPRNAHALSVHPAGMAVDFRVPANAAARAWLEQTLLALETKGLLDVTREKSPAHYHVAVYPAAYRAYVEKLAGPSAFVPKPIAVTPAVAPVAEPEPVVSVAMAAATASVEGELDATVFATLLVVSALGAMTVATSRRRVRLPA